MVKFSLFSFAGKKGVASWIPQVVVSLTGIGVVGLLYFLLFGKYFDVHAMIMSNEVKRHVINMAQVVVSSDKIVYAKNLTEGGKVKSTRFYRGVLDSDKLDRQMITKGVDDELNLNENSELREDISYPGAATVIVIQDVQTGKSWALNFGGPGIENTAELGMCLIDQLKLSDIFEKVIFNNAYRVWKDWDTAECFKTYGNKTGVFDQEFPVLIEEDGAYHPGRLYIQIMEL